MKIAILIPSRGRPRLLSAAITALKEMESGENDVTYVVGFDKDDPETGKISEKFQFHKVESLLISESILTIGGIWNYLASDIGADIYSCMIDDALPISPHWDRVMVNMAKKHQAFTWLEISSPGNAGYPTCTRKWLDACGYIVPEYFPFWFSDTWFGEMVQFVNNSPVPSSIDMMLYSRQESTHNLRDLDFWWGFFSATRRDRLAESYRIATMNGFTGLYDDFLNSRRGVINAARARDKSYFGDGIKIIETQRRDERDPPEKYILAKKRAEDYLETNGLRLWGDLHG